MAAQLKGTIRGDALTVQADVGQWPIAHVIVQATFSVPAFQPEHSMLLAPRNIETVFVQVPGNSSVTARLESRGAVLLFLRVVDALPLTAW